jgi:translation initiation factor 1 (eIF-1/SUI1)
MPTCDNCGGHVSDQFVRVFGDENDAVHACLNCAANAGIAETTRERARQS